MPPTLGPFRLRRVIAADGSGTVYEAVDPRVEHRLAVRTFADLAPRSLGADEQARLRDTVLAAADVSHPNIVAVHDFEWEGQTAFVVTELVDGETLEHYLQRVGRLPAFHGLALAAQLLSALSFAHERGLVHSAIHPRHLLVGRDGRLKVDGFGWIGVATPGAGRAGRFDQVRYQAPEQVLQQPVDHRTDLYSAAVVAYELLTGTMPLPAEEDPTPQHYSSWPPRPVGSARPELPPALDAVFAKALAPSPDARYQHAEVLGAALQGALGLPVWNRPDKPVRPSRVQDDAPAAAPPKRPRPVTDTLTAREISMPLDQDDRSRLVFAAVCAGAVAMAASLLLGQPARLGPADRQGPRMVASQLVEEKEEIEVAPLAPLRPSAPPAAAVASPPVAAPAPQGVELPREHDATRRMGAGRDTAVPPRDAKDAGDAPRASQVRHTERPARPDPRHVQRVGIAAREVMPARPVLGCQQDLSFAREMCVVVRCATADFRRHPVCVRLHAEARVRHQIAESHSGP